MKKSLRNSDVSTTALRGTPLSLSSLVAATERDHKRLVKKIHPHTEQLVSTLLELANSSESKQFLEKVSCTSIDAEFPYHERTMFS